MPACVCALVGVPLCQWLPCKRVCLWLCSHLRCGVPCMHGATCLVARSVWLCLLRRCRTDCWRRSQLWFGQLCCARFGRSCCSTRQEKGCGGEALRLPPPQQLHAGCLQMLCMCCSCACTRVSISAAPRARVVALSGVAAAHAVLQEVWKCGRRSVCTPESRRCVVCVYVRVSCGASPPSKGFVIWSVLCAPRFLQSEGGSSEGGSLLSQECACVMAFAACVAHHAGLCLPGCTYYAVQQYPLVVFAKPPALWVRGQVCCVLLQHTRAVLPLACSAWCVMAACCPHVTRYVGICPTVLHTPLSFWCNLFGATTLAPFCFLGSSFVRSRMLTGQRGPTTP